MQKLLLKDLQSSIKSLHTSAINQITSVQGGCIHDAWCIELKNGQKLFAKTNQKQNFPILEFEAEGLKVLKKYTDESFLEIPITLNLSKESELSVLTMNWIDMQQGDQTKLGEGLARLHRVSAEKNTGKFGWAKNGFIGSGIQIGGWEEEWGKSFVLLRLLPQLEIAEKWGIKNSEYSNLLENLIDFLNQHNPKPSLVHGDLWSGNAATNASGLGVIFDPAAWWADREVDIAMTYLFGGFSSEFYKGYEKVWPLSNTAKYRYCIYNLYHLLNHANLFGGGYKEQCQSQIKELRLKFN